MGQRFVGPSRASEMWSCDARLLAHGEAEIVSRGYRTFDFGLSNRIPTAIKFYHAHGQGIARAFPHEGFPIVMLECSNLSAGDER